MKPLKRQLLTIQKLSTLFIIIFSFFTSAIYASENIKHNKLEQLLNIYTEASDVIGDNPSDPIEVEIAGDRLQHFFTADAKVVVAGATAVEEGSGNAGVLFAEFVSGLFAHNNYYHTRHNREAGKGISIERIEDGVFKVVSYVTAELYQEGNAMFKLAAHYEDIVVATDQFGAPNPNGQYLRVQFRAVVPEASVSINGGVFEMPMSIAQ